MTLPVVYSESFRLHQPQFELGPGGRVLPYFETPRRAEVILEVLRATPWVKVLTPEEGRHDSLPLLVHDGDYVWFLRNGFKEWLATHPSLPPNYPPTYYPSSFPPPRARRKLKGEARLNTAEGYGYYTYDLTAPLVEGTYDAALGAACCAMTAANLVLYGDQTAYALCRPPGHHAGRDFSGGYCYFNNTAIAAKILSVRGPVAVVDIDYHHGNGTQDIFWEDDRVLTISLHCDPRMEYPYFIGFADEVGSGAGEGYNLNLPLPPHTTGEWYLKALELALDRLRLFEPWALIIAAGFDTHRHDPLSRFKLDQADYGVLGRQLRALNLPTVIIQEGGYDLDLLGLSVAAFLEPFAA